VNGESPLDMRGLDSPPHCWHPDTAERLVPLDALPLDHWICCHCGMGGTSGYEDAPIIRHGPHFKQRRRTATVPHYATPCTRKDTMRTIRMDGSHRGFYPATPETLAEAAEKRTLEERARNR
jgi:hypothetical protein